MFAFSAFRRVANFKSPDSYTKYVSGRPATQGGASAGGFKWLHKGDVWFCRWRQIGLSSKEAGKGGADGGTAVTSAGGVCV